MEASESKLVNPVLNTISIDSLRLRGLHIDCIDSDRFRLILFLRYLKINTKIVGFEYKYIKSNGFFILLIRLKICFFI